MRRLLKTVSILAVCFAAFAADAAATGRVIKVLPHFLDLDGRHAVSPGLFDRDAYQAMLRAHPEKVSALRYDIHWKASAAKGAKLRLRLELRGVPHGKQVTATTLETEVTPGVFSHWSSLTFSGEEFKKLGEVTAWRATLWDGDKFVGKQQSFLW